MFMTGDELRKAFLDFFADKGHLIMPSAPLIPEDDPSLLWINAGMAPFKPYFDGRLTPPEDRIATSQKCIRTNDIENVGRTVRHQTFFEMLGNFSFGDYFKKEAISWAWKFVTEILKLEEERLWITIYEEDEESFQIWNNDIGLDKERIVRMGKDENFWQIGTGPCGPCSEIHYDCGEEYGTGEKDVIGGEGDRYLEIWNLVFTQYDYTDDGEYLSLPNKNIDTGMGLERVASILQDVDSNFETDLLKPMIDYVQGDTGIDYKQNEDVTMAYRVIADHIRGITMSIFDGVLPANEGRGYVIRRLLRRAVRYGGELGYDQPFLYRLVPVVNETMAGGYPDLKDKREHIQSVVKAEEERFFETLEQGLDILNEMMEKLAVNNQIILSGEDAFKLYDTYGFPLDLTKDILTEKGFKIDEEGFAREMEKQRQRARQARTDTGFSGPESEKIYSDIKENIDEIEFNGYTNLKVETEIVALLQEGKKVEALQPGEEGEVILKKTPFYGESGGQIGDKGLIIGSESKARVYDTNIRAELFVHSVQVEDGRLKNGQSVVGEVFTERRQAIACNHSTTHLLHQALREILGEHVNQSGSLVAPDRLRFDFSHYSALEPEELKEIEGRVNEKIRENLPVKVVETTIEEAEEMGATALFSDKYSDDVRVVKMGDYSMELCGGTHIDATGEIGVFKIINESGVAAGTRRIEAVTGRKAMDYINKRENILQEAADTLNDNPDNLPERIEQLLTEQKELKKEITSLKDKMANFKSRQLLDQIKKVNGVPLLTAELKGLDNDGLRNLADQLKSEVTSGIIVLASILNEKVIFVVTVSKDLVEEGYHAGEMISRIARITGGGGGGRPDMAQAGGTKAEKISEALAEAEKILLNGK